MLGPLAGAAAPAAAQATAAAAPGAPLGPAVVSATAAAASSSSAGSLLQTIFALCLVLGLLVVLAWFLKRYGPRAPAGAANVRIVGALNLGGRERVIVVEVGEQWIVVGASPGRINALATMPRQAGAEAPDQGAELAQAAGPAPHAGSFAEWLKQTIDKRNAK
ncbi:flagellar biosynthetic protein FliO [Massilia glaciei]|uniref:Flagellar protein n=2 Tax=Massilia glaciei TaxID=1524097 RepID=A0A2U2HGP4_9BURK|nr:flagellar biosynthetic protein FliO [Massilia glaciei]